MNIQPMTLMPAVILDKDELPEDNEQLDAMIKEQPMKLVIHQLGCLAQRLEMLSNNIAVYLMNQQSRSPSVIDLNALTKKLKGN